MIRASNSLAAGAPWLVALRRYVLFATGANLAWETAHVPLYTIWREGTPGEIAFAVVHCTGANIVISVVSLVLALLLAGNDRWPAQTGSAVAALTTLLGVSSAVFFEWLNTVVRKSWAYSDLMPVIPLVDAGLSPVAQWIAIPLAALWWAGRPAFRVRTVMEFRT